jgi:glycosyltransferase involved in cell wall biosynthesis
MPRHDIAIYAPFAHSFYDAAADRNGGGAERQTWLLAQRLSARGLRVAHITYPVDEPRIDPAAPVTLIQRAWPRDHGSARAFAEEAWTSWRALDEADAAVQLFRGAAGAVGIGGLWARAHRRKLVFAGANNHDFTDAAFDHRRDPRAVLFRTGLRLADAVVVQTADQAGLARGARLKRGIDPQQIASFVETAPAPSGPGEAFLWVSRLADYKRPLLYADLAAAVPEARFWMIPIESDEPTYETTLAELERRSADLPNLELLPQRRHAELQELVSSAVAMVNTSEFEGMPNTWLEGWARGIPALTFSFDPDHSIDRNGLGISGAGSWDAFVAGARRLWEARDDRAGFSEAVRGYVATTHGDEVERRWAEIIERLARS